MPTQIFHPVPEKFAKTAHITLPQYHEMYQRSIKDPNTFWGEEALKFTDRKSTRLNSSHTRQHLVCRLLLE